LPYSEVAELVDEILKRQALDHPENFNGRAIHKFLTLAQMDELIKKRKDYLKESYVEI